MYTAKWSQTELDTLRTLWEQTYPNLDVHQVAARLSAIGNTRTHLAVALKARQLGLCMHGKDVGRPVPRIPVSPQSFGTIGTVGTVSTVNTVSTVATPSPTPQVSRSASRTTRLVARDPFTSSHYVSVTLPKLRCLEPSDH